MTRTAGVARRQAKHGQRIIGPPQKTEKIVR